MKKLTKFIFSIILTACVICTNIPLNIMAAEIKSDNIQATEVLAKQTGATYYIKNGGNDEADGKSEETAWASLEKINATTFQAGDSILLKRGDTWNGQLWPQGSGNATEGGYIRLGAYGTGNRPIINGGGTGAAKKLVDNKTNATNKQFISGAVMLVNQEYWVIEDLEVTNTGGAYVSNRHGILALNTAPVVGVEANKNILNFIRIRNNYVHDVDTLDITDWDTPYSNYGSSTRHSDTHKMTGGITAIAWNAELDGAYDKNGVLNEVRILNKSAGFHDVIIENNHVLRVSKEGIRTKSTQFTALTGFNESYPKKNKDVIIRNNYIEKVFGDAIVLSEVISGGLVEHNVVNGHTFSSGANYAGVWNHYCDDAIVQYNEVFNGNNAPSPGDGEGFDIDNSCYRNTFQYNYSHNNAGGLILFMTSQYDSVFRYNISTNDAHKTGQQTFYYSYTGEDNKRPKIYNNTIYVDKDTKVSALTYSDNTSMDFQNNIVLVHGTLGQLTGVAFNENSIVKNNSFYPASIAFNKGLTESQLVPENNNIFADPKFVNISANSVREDDKYSFIVNKENNVKFSDKEMLRARIAKYKLSNQSPEIFRTGGVAIANEGDYPVAPTEDIFGNTVGSTNVSIGAHQWTTADSNNEYIAPDNATVTSVTLDKTALAMKVGNTKQLIATVNGDGLTDTFVSWTSSKPEIATINPNGEIKAIAEGTTTITATSNRDNSKTATCEVTVAIKTVVSYSPTTLNSYKGVKPPLPNTIKVLYNDDSTINTAVKWNEVPPTDYNDTPVGSTYKVKGTTDIDVEPEITVTQIEAGTITKVDMVSAIDSYSQNGGASTDGTKLRVKGSSSIGFGRQAYIKFNLASLGFDKSQANDAVLRMYLSSIDTPNEYRASKFNVYVLDDAESKAFMYDEGTKVYAEIPSTNKVVNGMEVKYLKTEPLPEYIDIHVGDAVKYADSEGNITFKIKCEEPPSTTNIDNSGIDFYSRNYQNGEKSPQLFVTNNYITDIATINPITTYIGEAPTGLPETVDVIFKSMDTNNILTSATGRKVIWDTPTQEQLNTVGSYTLYGTVENTNLKASVTINVFANANEYFKKVIEDSQKILDDKNSTAKQIVKAMSDLAKAMTEFESSQKK